MFLIDSNVIIDSYLLRYEYLRKLFVPESTFASEISRVEVLGYHKLAEKEDLYLKEVFSVIPCISPSPQIFDAAIELRKKYNLKLGDSIIAATALVHDLSIYTRNLKDFEKIVAINCINPVI
jgi:hypothetical protein